MAKREVRTIHTAVFKLPGQFETGPKAVCDQSNARINAPISPPPEKTESIATALMLPLLSMLGSAVSDVGRVAYPREKSHRQRLLSLLFVMGLRWLEGRC